jgi:hypothetical protein
VAAFEAGVPRVDRDRLVQELGAVRGGELENEVKSLFDELSRIEVDWSVHSLSSAGQMARESMRARRPDLSEEALRALEWKFTFDWR